MKRKYTLTMLAIMLCLLMLGCDMNCGEPLDPTEEAKSSTVMTEEVQQTENTTEVETELVEETEPAIEETTTEEPVTEEPSTEKPTLQPPVTEPKQDEQPTSGIEEWYGNRTEMDEV